MGFNSGFKGLSEASRLVSPIRHDQMRRAHYVLGYRHTQTFASGMQISSDVTAIFHFLSLADNGKRATLWGKGWERSAGMAVIGRGTHGVGDLLLVQLEHRNVDLIMADSCAGGDLRAVWYVMPLTIGKYLRTFRRNESSRNVDDLTSCAN